MSEVEISDNGADAQVKHLVNSADHFIVAELTGAETIYLGADWLRLADGIAKLYFAGIS